MDRNGWQAQIVGPVQDGSEEPPIVTDEKTARQIATSLGIEVEEDIDAGNGLWMVTLTEEQLEQMRKDTGWLDATGPLGSVLVDAGDAQ